jgi:hypothetical protein
MYASVQTPVALTSLYSVQVLPKALKTVEEAAKHVVDPYSGITEDSAAEGGVPNAGL